MKKILYSVDLKADKASVCSGCFEPTYSGPGGLDWCEGCRCVEGHTTNVVKCDYCEYPAHSDYSGSPEFGGEMIYQCEDCASGAFDRAADMAARS
jgi:hypothetical protein